LCRMLSIVTPCASCDEACEPAWVEFWNTVGELETGPEIAEWCSWLVPYMIRAKLRFDMIPSRRLLGGYPAIVHLSMLTGTI
jgi:hypothetical protein